MSKIGFPTSKRAGHGDVGSVTVLFLLLLPALFLVVGLVIDGGRAMAARQALVVDAQNAARVGAGTLSVDGLHRGVISIDQSAATANAEAYLERCGVNGTVAISGGEVSVSVTSHVRTTMLAMIGIEEIPVAGSATAVNLAGVNRGTP